MVFARHGQDWTVQALTAADTLDMPEIDVALPLLEIYAETGPTSEDGVGRRLNHAFRAIA